MGRVGRQDSEENDGKAVDRGLYAGDEMTTSKMGTTALNVLTLLL